MKHRLDFTEVIHRLGLWREEAIAQLADSEAHAEALMLKRQLDSAISVLELCGRYQIRPDCRVTVLPDLQTMSHSCAYRVIEDNETEEREDWIELKIDGERLELSPGDIVFEQQRLAAVSML